MMDDFEIVVWDFGCGAWPGLAKWGHKGQMSEVFAKVTKDLPKLTEVLLKVTEDFVKLSEPIFQMTEHLSKVAEPLKNLTEQQPK
ncbi:hypothetical protein [Sutcliffiella horikoshii]|uniref:hypothetical protein n=1 Tax=Sutcliffiella horikoshii TaxID=79883 RepID=UPI001653C108|nr:hypothetical protein [Sutcliffiella horikoshii]